MFTKHPQAPTPTIPTDLVPPPADITDADVLRALKSFPSGSAPGPSSCRANHLKEAVLCPSPDRAGHALRALCGVVKLLCAGEANPEVAPYLCGATLLAIQKKGGGLRPIAVGETLRRLTSKCLSWAVQKAAYRTLTPLQLGVGVKCGCEAIVHSVSRTLEDHKNPWSRADGGRREKDGSQLRILSCVGNQFHPSCCRVSGRLEFRGY